MKLKKLALCILAASPVFFSQVAEAGESPKEASVATKTLNNQLLTELPFNDKESFNNASKGFIAPLPDNGVIKNAEGEVIWDLGLFSFIKENSPSPDTVNPSLWRQAQLVAMGGLFKVHEHIYQVRTADLSNITFIEGPQGIIVMDPLISTETAKASLDLYFKHRPTKPIVAVIYTHSHVDHYGGVKGVVSEDEVKSGKVKIIAPVGFIEAAVAENVMAGNAMSRRASYMYGNLLPMSATGQVGAGLGMTTSSGTVSLIPPTDLIKTSGQYLNLAGLDFVFHMAPDSEAPSEMFFYIPEYHALCTAEDSTHTLHNTYSLRGAAIRNPLAWSKYLNEVMYLWGNDAQVLFAPHHWPVWEKDNIVKHLKLQRDMYRFINDQTLHYANQGFTMDEIAEKVKLPEPLSHYWSNRGYYGTMNHNTKATYVKYLGWFSGNPATLHPLEPVESSKKYVDYMGGATKIIKQARKDYEQGNYRWVAEVMNRVVFAEPENQEARNLEADALEQLGYQAESGPWRNFYLSGAKELRNGVQKLSTPHTASADTIRAMSTDLFFDFLAVKLNGEKAANTVLSLNFVFPDINEKYVVELNNGSLHHIQGYQVNKADATITLDRETLNQIIMKQKTIASVQENKELKIDGNQEGLKQLLSFIDNFDFWFNIVTPNH
ncbi:Metallo-beta-lactamase superfamily protein [Legionella massiliensis]|uniref:Linear primary-alkylsulfatase n=1 Tax=Legionella massiliensis TaxID=1034943 RepID=A0A078L2X3_9GAMM|nr:alkyl sulfatase dimerization domain-containing protein [Legionella massiliensis]CDZ78449.1 Metallo-beta-lactamase superfamily protein [Legionella massiliensis]CEE14187.1 Metallo-beta-lactamase superfamily protein [Legionella massiliensis]